MDLMTTAEKVLTLQTLCGLELGGGSKGLELQKRKDKPHFKLWHVEQMQSPKAKRPFCKDLKKIYNSIKQVIT